MELKEIEAEANQKWLEIYMQFVDWKITFEEHMHRTKEIIADYQKRIQDEINRLLCIEYYWKQ